MCYASIPSTTKTSTITRYTASLTNPEATGVERPVAPTAHHGDDQSDEPSRSLCVIPHGTSMLTASREKDKEEEYADSCTVYNTVLIARYLHIPHTYMYGAVPSLIYG